MWASSINSESVLTFIRFILCLMLHLLLRSYGRPCWASTHLCRRDLRSTLVTASQKKEPGAEELRGRSALQRSIRDEINCSHAVVLNDEQLRGRDEINQARVPVGQVAVAVADGRPQLGMVRIVVIQDAEHSTGS